MKASIPGLFWILLLNLIVAIFSKIELNNEKESKKINLKSNFCLVLIIFISSIYFFLKKRKNKKDFQKYIDQENSKPIDYINNGDEIRGDYSKYISQKRRKQKNSEKIG